MDKNILSTTSEATQSEQTTDVSSVHTEPAETNDNAEANASTEQTIVSADTEDGGISLVKDPVTGKTSLKFGNNTDDTPTEEEHSTEPADNPLEGEEKGTDSLNIGQQQLKEAPLYDLEEFSAALANGRVDPNRVPQEYQAQYADYRIREAIQQRQAQQQAAMQREAVQRQQIAQQMSPEQRVQANKEFYRALDEQASFAAMKDLGITQEQLAADEYSEEGEALRKQYEDAVGWHKQRLRGEMQARYQQEQAYQQQQQSVYADIQAFVEQERAKDPNFDAIDRMLATRYRTLPFEQGQIVAGALTALQNGTIDQRGVQIIQQYFQDCRKEYYAQKSGLKPNGQGKPAPRKNPPVVENAGQGQQVEKRYRPNYSNLRNAKNADQRKAWFNEYFKNKGW